ncbi:MAG: nucleotidyl transferase AbiEii/AbiGii toxin family protein [Dysgonamonadaceae bacterium]|nr:nucleotidyl transferase AbiEii/AbiGii toxin family protein [Dysgonamonadaceae bacterium]
MKLHQHTQDFIELVKLTANHFNIATGFIEKDYWITLILCRLSQSTNSKNVVFKGGTSLSKGYRLVNRFSEDIDLAMINENLSGNALKTKIRTIEKEITAELTEIVEPYLTSKGSMYRKSLFSYPSIITDIANTPKRIIVEINAFANPYPFVQQGITSFITEYLKVTNQEEAIEQYQLQPFSLNILDKRRTIVEKLVSLIRFSFSEDTSKAIASKIRHFYDLYYLATDAECAQYIQSDDFQKDLSELVTHDQLTFDEPTGWQTKSISESPLVTNFPAIWENVRFVYQNELTTLAFSEIPNDKLVLKIFMNIMQHIKLCQR